MSLKLTLGNRPVIYEIVPPRRDTSRFTTELLGVEDVMSESRIEAINVPELINRREEKGKVHYSPATIPPEEYAMMIRDYKEAIVNVVAPRLTREQFLRRTRKILHEYGIPNLILVGRERHEDILPGPGVVEALNLARAEKADNVTLGGVCIFDRRTSTSIEYGGRGSTLEEPKRILAKAKAGCEFVTSQITFDPEAALNFLLSYQEVCRKARRNPMTVFVSLATVPTRSILKLLDSLDVSVPPRIRNRLVSSDKMGAESLKVAAETFEKIVYQAEQLRIRVPLGLQIEQVGVHGDALSLELLDRVYPMLGR